MQIHLIKNLTTDETLFKASPTESAEVVEVDRRSVSFQLAETKHPWQMTSAFSFSLQGVIALLPKAGLRESTQNANFDFIGKISLQDNDGTSVRLRLDLVQYDRALWLAYLEQLQLRQIRAETVFRAIKGDA